MDNNVKAKFEQVKVLAHRGDSYKGEGNYEFASNCYQKAGAIMRGIVKQTNKLQTIQLLKNKIQKYDNLAADMLKKLRERSKGKNISKIVGFGFPEIPQPQSLPIINVQNQKRVKSTQNEKTFSNQNQNDGEVEGMISKDIKTGFDDIIGMVQLKEILYEAVIIPQKRPDLFKGIREPPRGILLYGPPGNGKTFITKALAKQSGCTFYGLSAGTIVNKFVGETEKTMRKIFDNAKKNSPSIIFIDEIDSILTARSQSDGDATRRLKTEFLVQFDGLEGTRVILIGATNLPNELDLAALRRFNKLVYVGLPDKDCRKGIIQKTLKDIKYELNSKDLSKLVDNLQGYSSSEVTDIIKQASMMPIREISRKTIQTVDAGKIRAVKFYDFEKVLKVKKPLLNKEDLIKYEGKFK